MVFGGVLLVSAKGKARHRALGRACVGLMTHVVISTFFISELRLWDALSPIHLLSIWTLFSLAMAVHLARHGNIRQDKIWMVLL